MTTWMKLRLETSVGESVSHLISRHHEGFCYSKNKAWTKYAEVPAMGLTDESVQISLLVLPLSMLEHQNFVNGRFPSHCFNFRCHPIF
jgi:hypothetical protein